ncbi:UDP-N-acetylmuramoyl-L-alanyl-D-glutamate--2,6-diaminopimelate ligase [Nosocomiicoccus massiliensis]|uniref:UDP-N-acetylmuramoyl-L-alanyl-D-glutamate--2, 6-diaminopimelate ligase n=1 Tax=Nosocomiicoccus massiliensis TaxID=1232430 RepID=UPI000417B527|nr:UDP-N-acetylmuramoyl-L-alanyl-D-glutamate--2,6-diaminopimelate ligase [Nosocomiicoccus massiliensis]
MKTEQLISLLKIKEIYGTLPDEVFDITIDSREVSEGTIFVALKGATTDGFDYIEQAIEKGSKMILSDRNRELPKDVGLLKVKDPVKVSALFAEYLYDFPHESMTMVGVTGTNGKTTVSTMIHNLSMSMNKKSAYLGTNGFMINEDTYPSLNTTPETTRLHKNFNEAVKKETEVFTMEVSSHALKLGRTFGVDFDIVIFTNLTQDHLDFHDTMENYGFTKGLLFSQLGQDLKKTKYVILNNSDPWSKEYASMTPYEVISYGLDNSADFYPTDIKGSLEGTSFTLHTPDGEFFVESPFVGDYNIENLMCAIISEWLQGYDLNDVIEAIKQMKAVSGRLEVLDNELPIHLIIDFAHTPDALEKVIQTIRPFNDGKLITVYGMTGERDYSKAEEMGRIASQSDYVVITVDNPGNDDKNMLIDIVEKGMTHDNYTTEIDREQAIKIAIDYAEPGDTVFLAGKGREPYQIMENHIKEPHRDDLIALNFAYKKYNFPGYEN